VVSDEEKPIPYARFKEVNDKLKAQEAQLKAIEDAKAQEKAEAEKARLAALPEQERLKEQAQSAAKLQGENTSLQAQVQSLQSIVDSYLKAELEAVAPEHRRVIEGMASDPAGQLKALALLRQNGLLGGKPGAVPTHNGKPGGNATPKPGTREEARQAMLRALAGKK
jgi:hypothetical protein